MNGKWNEELWKHTNNIKRLEGMSDGSDNHVDCPIALMLGNINRVKGIKKKCPFTDMCIRHDKWKHKQCGKLFVVNPYG